MNAMTWKGLRGTVSSQKSTAKFVYVPKHYTVLLSKKRTHHSYHVVRTVLGSKKVEQPKDGRSVTPFPREKIWNSVLLSCVKPQISITGLVRMPWSANNRKSD